MDGNTGGNAFLTSIQQLGQWLQQQNQGTGSGDAGFNLGSGYQQPSKVITQVHYTQPQTSTNDANAQPAVTTAPAAPQVSSFAPPQGSAQAVPQPNAVDVPSPQAASTPQQRGIGGGGGQTSTADMGNTVMDLLANGGGGGAAGAAGGTGPGSGVPTSNAISGISSALAKGVSDAGKAIGAVKTMPTPIQSGPFPGINQQTPSLIGRRTQPAY